MDEFHAAREFAAADAGEGDAVAVLRIHVGLHLEDEAGDLGLLRFDGARIGGAGLRRRGVGDQAFQQFTHRIVFQRGAEIDRG